MTCINAQIKHFKKEELQCKCCGKFNVDNNFLIRLEAFRLALNLPMVVTSCCRCLKHNAEVGGVKNSLHQCETKASSACDFYCKDMQKAYNTACNMGGGSFFNEVIWYKNRNFIHIGFDSNQKGNYHIIK